MHDSLGYVKSLESAGVPVKQAEAQVQMMTDIINSELATRQDLDKQSVILRSEMREMETRLRSEMKELAHKIDLSQEKMTIKLGSMMIAGFGALAAFIHFVH